MTCLSLVTRAKILAAFLNFIKCRTFLCCWSLRQAVFITVVISCIFNFLVVIPWMTIILMYPEEYCNEDIFNDWTKEQDFGEVQEYIPAFYRAMLFFFVGGVDITAFLQGVGNAILLGTVCTNNMKCTYYWVRASIYFVTLQFLCAIGAANFTNNYMLFIALWDVLFLYNVFLVFKYQRNLKLLPEQYQDEGNIFMPSLG